MLNKPGIVTAIPKRRFSLGEFIVTVLGEVDSRDGIDYCYIAAVIRGQDPEPGVYITAEREDGSQGGEISVRVIMHGGAEIIDRSARWNDVDAFAEEALRITSQLLQLSDETPYRLL